MSSYPHKATCLWYKWLTTERIEQWEESGSKKKRAKISVQEGGQERDEYSLIAEKHFYGTKALLQLLCSLQAMQCILGTEAPNISNIEPSGDIKRQTWAIESQLPFPGQHFGR